MKPALRQHTIEDLRLLAALGVLLAFLVSVLIFRQFRVALIMSAGPVLGVVWTLGVMGWVGEPISVFSTVLPPLLFVIGYANAAHIVVSIHRLTGKAASNEVRSREGFARVHRACAVSAITTGIGFASLYFVGSAPVARFGLFAGVGCVLTYLAVVLVTPLLCVSFFRPVPTLQGDGYSVLSQCFQSLGRFAIGRARLIVMSGSLLTVSALLVGFNAVPDFRFRENFSPNNDFYRAVELSDEQFGGAFSLTVMTSWTAPGAQPTGNFMALQGRLEEAAARFFRSDRVVGANWLNRVSGGHLVSPSDSLSKIGPGDLLRRFVDPELGRSVISVPIPDLGGRELIPRIASFRTATQEIVRDYPGYQVEVTGLAFLALYGSDRVITDIARSLGVAVLAILIVVSLALRSVYAGLVCMLPNILPVAGVASIMVIFGLPLQYTSVLVFAVSLGVAVDDSVHLMMRERLLRTQTEGGGGAALQTIVSGLGQAGPAMVFSTLVTIAGFAALIFSDTVSIAAVGYLSILALILGLFADLLFLPALLALWRTPQLSYFASSR